MKRLLALLIAVVALVVVASACPPESSSIPCGDPASFDLTGCDRASLQTVEPGGAWNLENQWLGGTFTYGAFNLDGPDGGTLSGQPIDLHLTSESSYFLSSTYKRGEQTYRMAYSGCGATDPQHFGGLVHFCKNGVRTSNGLFKAGRLGRRAGEGEASQLVLLSESRLSAGTPTSVFVSGGRAYVAALSSLTIFDVSDPANPVSLARIDASRSDGGTDYWNDAWARGNVLYIASADEGIRIYDVSNPAQPVRLGSFPADKPHVHRFSADGDRLYAASPAPDGTVLIVDVSTPASPVLLSRFIATWSDPIGGAWPSTAVASGSRLFVAHRALGFVIADISDAGTPRELGTFVYPGIVTSNTVAVGPVGDKTIAFESGEGWNGHLRVLDVTNPATISQVADLPQRPQISIHQLALAGTRLYIAYYQDGVRVLDVSTPSAPVQVAYFNTWSETDPQRGRSFFEGASAIHLPGDGHVYVADTIRGLMIFNEL